ncbi:MAG TPA: glycosyltransferase family 9 protein [Nitrospira sp.]|jgi:lipopolysaccharide heptosyltransferase II|nr:glycosyltransferase family 9 protein [Nitrospira sp.]
MTTSASSSAGWDQARHVLCVRLDAAGDVLMTEPALRALAATMPERRLTLLTSRSGREAARLIRCVEDVIVYEAPWMKSVRTTSSADDRAMIARLRAERFDAAAIFTVYTQSALPAALLCTLAEIPRRAAHCRENPYHLLTEWVRETEPDVRVRHEVRRQLDLAAALGGRVADDRLSISIGGAALRTTDRLLCQMIDPVKRWIVMHPGASAPSRRYPVESFAAAAAQLTRDFDCQILWTGSQEEAALIAEAQAIMSERSHSLAGRLSFEELAALIAKAPLVISNNTSVVHLAAAVSTPVVDLYALTNPQHTPWRVPCRVLFEDVPCRFCYKSVCPEVHHRCLKGVAPDAVVSAAVQLLERNLDNRSTSAPGDETTCLFEDNLRAWRASAADKSQRVA